MVQLVVQFCKCKLKNKKGKSFRILRRYLKLPTRGQIFFWKFPIICQLHGNINNVYFLNYKYSLVKDTS